MIIYIIIHAYVCVCMIKKYHQPKQKKKKENYLFNIFPSDFYGWNYKTVTVFTFMIFKTLKPCIEKHLIFLESTQEKLSTSL